MKKLLYLLWIVPLFGFGQETINVEGTNTLGGHNADYFLNTSSDAQTKAGQLTLSDSLIYSLEATGDTKVFGPTGTGGMKTYETADGTEITWSKVTADSVIVNSVLRGETSLWYYASSVCAFEVSPGGSGAVLVVPDANTLGGYQLDAVGEKLYMTKSVIQLWDGASDLELKVTWEVNEASASDGTVDLQLICYYKGHYETVNKTQTLEEAVTITDNKAQYTRYTTTFTIDWDKVSNVVEVGDKISFILNLQTATSECDDIIVNMLMFKFKTNKVRIEV